MILRRRGFLLGAGLALAAPAIVRVENLMKVLDVARPRKLLTPEGWLLCDGRLVERSLYAELFGIVGTTFGGGWSDRQFALPDLRAAFSSNPDPAQPALDVQPHICASQVPYKDTPVGQVSYMIVRDRVREAHDKFNAIPPSRG